jgi:RimJ/RimL family protein N-acetyltransferase
MKATQASLDSARLHAVPVVELTESDRPILLEHLLALDASDRHLRFGNPLSDAIIRQYVDSIDLVNDVVFGVFHDDLKLDAAGHFAHLPSLPSSLERQSAEFGLSVAARARGLGLGTALFVRAATRARNDGVSVLFMHCLTQNQAMMRIARRAGMQISASYGEADAYLTLEPGDAASRIAEAMHEQIGLFDYALKQQRMNIKRLWSWALPLPSKI